MTYTFYSKIAPEGIYEDGQGNRVKIEWSRSLEESATVPADPQALWTRIAEALELVASKLDKT